MHKRTRALIDYGTQCGFSLDGVDGRGHYLLVHPNGETVRVAGSPGDLRGDANAQAEMRRKSGVTPPRPAAATYRHRRHRGFDMRAALREKDEAKTGHWQCGTRADDPRTKTLRARLATLTEQITERPYPYLIQEQRRIQRLIDETTSRN